MTSAAAMVHGPFGGGAPDGLRALVQALLPERPKQAAPFLDDAAVDLARAESLGALLGARVAQGRITVRPDRRVALVAEYHRCVAANFARAREVAALRDLVGDCGIPILLLKGMALIQSTFGEGERSMGDVDVLVPASRWAETCALVQRAGWKEDAVPGRGYTIAHDYVRSFTTGPGVTVELHRFVCEQSLFALDYDGADGLFARARRLPSGLFVPDDGDLFLTLAAHAAKHTFELPLRSFVDGLFLLRQSRFRSDELIARAKAWRMATAFRCWLASLRWLDEACVKEGGFLDDGQFPSPGGLGARAGRWLWSHTAHESPWQRFLRLAWLTDGPQAWTQHVATRVGLRAIDLVDERRRRRHD